MMRVLFRVPEPTDLLAQQLEGYLGAWNISCMSDSSIRWQGQFIGLLCCEHMPAQRDVLGDRKFVEEERQYISRVAGSVMPEALMQAQARGCPLAPSIASRRLISCRPTPRFRTR